jgi:hypothetical protein
MFNSFFKKKTPSADNILSTGKLNWRLKPKILALDGFPNLLKFISYYESKYNVQIGIWADVIENDGTRCCIFTQAIYDEEDEPTLRYNFFFEYFGPLKKFGFISEVTHYWNLDEMASNSSEGFAHISGEMKMHDLFVEEYERYYEEGYVQAMAKKHFDKNKFKMVRGNGLECYHKILEKDIRKRYP